MSKSNKPRYTEEAERRIVLRYYSRKDRLERGLISAAYGLSKKWFSRRKEKYGKEISEAAID